MIHLIYNNRTHGRTGRLGLDGFWLTPGFNELTVAQFERLERHPDWANYLEQGVLVVDEQRPDPRPSPEPTPQAAPPATDPVLAWWNSADQPALIAQPTIGKSRATAIIEGRPHPSLESVRLAAGAALSPEQFQSLEIPDADQ